MTGLSLTLRCPAYKHPVTDMGFTFLCVHLQIARNTFVLTLTFALEIPTVQQKVFIQKNKNVEANHGFVCRRDITFCTNEMDLT